MSKCPFSQEECNEQCALFINLSDLSETVRNRLTSIGVYDNKNGMCSLKNLALAQSRYIFENTSTFK